MAEPIGSDDLQIRPVCHIYLDLAGRILPALGPVWMKAEGQMQQEIRWQRSYGDNE
jgi:hypothetical protein